MPKLSDMNVGDSVIALNDGCGCIATGLRYTIKAYANTGNNLYITCNAGTHFLDDDLSDFRHVMRPRLVVNN